MAPKGLFLGPSGPFLCVGIFRSALSKGEPNGQDGEEGTETTSNDQAQNESLPVKEAGGLIDFYAQLVLLFRREVRRINPFQSAISFLPMLLEANCLETMTKVTA